VRGGRYHLKLTEKKKYYSGRPIANKYREGKIKRTLDRELKDLKLLKN